MLIGEYNHSIDTKGRVFMPAKFREDLGERFVVTRGIGKCLFVFSLEEWKALAAKLKEIPLADRSLQVFLRAFYASASECEVDKQGRILIPQRLRDIAGIQKEVTVIGVMSRVELWSREAWEEYNKLAFDEGFEETLSKLADLGI